MLQKYLSFGFTVVDLQVTLVHQCSHQLTCANGGSYNHIQSRCWHSSVKLTEKYNSILRQTVEGEVLMGPSWSEGKGPWFGLVALTTYSSPAGVTFDYMLRRKAVNFPRILWMTTCTCIRDVSYIIPAVRYCGWSTDISCPPPDDIFVCLPS